MKQKHRGMNSDALTLRIARIFYLLSPVVAFAVASIAFAFSSLTIRGILNCRSSLGLQISLGSAVGAVIALVIAAVLLKAEASQEVRELARNFFLKQKPTWIDIVMTAAMAGFSEELLFRGILQPLTNLWVASVVFAVAHGAGTSLSPGKLMYQGLVCFLGLLLGLTTNRLGLPAAMFMHGMADLVFLVIFMQWSYKPDVPSVEQRRAPAFGGDSTSVPALAGMALLVLFEGIALSVLLALWSPWASAVHVILCVATLIWIFMQIRRARRPVI